MEKFSPSIRYHFAALLAASYSIYKIIKTFLKKFDSKERIATKIVAVLI